MLPSAVTSKKLVIEGVSITTIQHYDKSVNAI